MRSWPSLLAPRRTRRGDDHVYVLPACPLLIPLAGPNVPFVVGLLAGTYLLVGFGVASSQVYVYSLRQGITPDRLLGRMNSAYRFFVTGMLPIGALLGGALGELIGLRSTLVVGSVLVALAVGWILASPIPRLRDLPETAPAERIMSP